MQNKNTTMPKLVLYILSELWKHAESAIYRIKLNIEII